MRPEDASSTAMRGELQSALQRSARTPLFPPERLNGLRLREATARLTDLLHWK
jgi:hypothetical protein